MLARRGCLDRVVGVVVVGGGQDDRFHLGVFQYLLEGGDRLAPVFFSEGFAFRLRTGEAGNEVEFVALNTWAGQGLGVTAQAHDRCF